MTPQPATRIRKIRKQQGLTLKQLAAALETTPQTIQRLESGNMTVSLKWLHDIARVLGVPAADLLVERARPPTAEDTVIELLRNELVRARRDPRERSLLALMEANGKLAAMLIEAQMGARPCQDVAEAAAAAAACAIRIALDGEPGQAAVVPPLALVR